MQQSKPVRQVRRQTPQQQASSPAEQPVKYRLDHRILATVEPDQLEEFLAHWSSCRSVREAIAGVLTKEIEDVIIKEESGKVLDSPNALAVIADQRGFRRGLRTAISLLTQQGKDHE